MSLIGNVSAYDESENFETYIQRIELFFAANDVSNAKRVPAFLSIIGPKLYSLVKDLVSPKTPSDCKFEDLVKVIKEHYKPQVVIISERFKFYSRKQESNENVVAFLAALKSLATTCKFENTLEVMLRDRFVMGLREEATQRALLTEKDLTFARAVEIAVARESAAKDAREFGRGIHGGHSSKDDVNSVKATFAKSSYKSNKSIPKEKSDQGERKKGSKPDKPCSGCGRKHWKSDCPFSNAECFLCKKKGHIAKVCFTKKQNSKSSVSNSKTKQVSSIESSSRTSFDKEFSGDYVFTATNNASEPFYVTLEVDGTAGVSFQVDTGAARTLMSYSDFLKTFPEPRPKLLNSTTVLRKYGGSSIPICGEFKATLKYRNQVLENRTILVVKDSGPNLLGRDLFPDFEISLNFPSVAVHAVDANSLLSKFPELFKDELGTFKGVEITLEVGAGKAPKFYKARNVPYAMKSKVDTELDRLLALNILEPVAHASCAAPIVPVLKGDGTIRICGDYRLTVNQVCPLNSYPVPRIDDLFATLGGGKVFSKLDMRNAYNQLLLSDESKPLTTINTHRGLFQYTRLCFGIASAPAIFQRTVEELLKGIPGVVVFLDDILCSGRTHMEHEGRLCEVLKRLEQVGLKLHPSKCCFGVSSVQYLGYVIDATGLRPTKEKVDAITDAPEPKDVTQLRGYLGMLNFYRKFLVNAATVLEPLNSLLRKDVKWNWSQEHSKAFRDSKSLLIDACLIHFDPSLPIVVSADSSKYGVGAVLCHLKDGEELPVVFASRTLNSAERNYSQTEKEALALVFALKRFHHYVWGTQFTLITDHKPLLGLFNPKKPIPEMASGRIQRWSLMLQAYSFDLYHRSGKSLGAADALSRLPLPSMPESVPVCAEWVHLVDVLDSAPVTSQEISKWTSKDPVLSQVLVYLDYGWPTTTDDEDLKPFMQRKDELSTQHGCVLWGSRVVVPVRCREALLEELHREHLGSTKMKQLARSYFWWPGLDKAIENLSSQCPVCLSHRPAPKRAPLHPWDWPEKPWVRLHADYAGPVNGMWFLVITDAHSKWIEVLPTKDTSSSATITMMRHVFSHFGLPMTLVTDNGSNFTSREFELFMSKNGIRHITSAPYQPSTNGQAENTVKSFKSFLKHCEGEDWRCQLDKFLFKYRVTPHSTTGVSPAELLFGRKLRTVLDLVHPSKSVQTTVLNNQRVQKLNYDGKTTRKVDLMPESPIMVRNYSTQSKNRWVPAKVVEQTGPVSYKCELSEGGMVRRHQDQLITRHPHSPNFSTGTGDPLTPVVPLRGAAEMPRVSESEPCGGKVASPGSSTPVRRSGRVVKPPVRLDL